MRGRGRRRRWCRRGRFGVGSGGPFLALLRCVGGSVGWLVGALVVLACGDVVGMMVNSG